LAGRIVELAKKDFLAALLLATRGVEFTEIQTMLQLYYGSNHELSQTKSGIKTEIQKLLENEVDASGGKIWTQEMINLQRLSLQKNIKDLTDQLCRIFLNAVNAGDSKKINEIADAIEFLKTFKKLGDKYRADILTWKEILDKKGEKWPIRRIAKAISWPDMSGTDGFKTVRRMCEELGFPLADSRHKANKPKPNP
jgi:hypothetical protein